MRLMHFAPLLLVLGCVDKSDPKETDLTATDDTDPVVSDCHPLVPEEFCYFWIVDEPCTKRGGREGTRVYRLQENGRVDAEGNFTATERWFWFEGDPDNWDQDKVDTIEYTGQISAISGGDLNCVGCEEVYEVTRNITENQTGTGYSENVVFAIDTLNPNGGFQEDNNTFVFYARYRRGELTDLDTDYARGKYYPDSGNPGEWPASYTWAPFDFQGKCY